MKDKELSTNTKLKIYKTVMSLVAMYAAEVICTTKKTGVLEKKVLERRVLEFLREN